MGFFKKETEIEQLIQEHFNPDPDNPYTLRIEEDGEFVDLKKEILDGIRTTRSPYTYPETDQENVPVGEQIKLL